MRVAARLAARFAARSARSAALLAVIAVVALSGILACRGDGRTPLVLYSPHGRDLLELMEREYELLHPEVDVRWLDMGSQEVYDRLRSEAANPQADVWFGGPDTIFARGAADGLLDPHRPAWADAVPPASRHQGDLYFGVYRTPAILVWNDRLVPAAEAPRDWEDLLAERFRDRVLIRDPLASGTMRTFFGFVIMREMAAVTDPEPGSTPDRAAAGERGFEFLRRLDAQTKEYVTNPALLFEKLVRGEGLVTVWDLTDVLLQRRRGAPLGYGFATSGTPVIDDSIGLVRGARHRAAAGAFIDWVGSREAQALAARELYRLPARTDLAAADLPEWARQVLAEMRPVDLDTELLARESATWMARWDREIRGKGRRQ